MIYILDGVRIHPDRPFVKNGVQYPANWLRSAAPGELAELGVETRSDAVSPNTRWFTASQRDDGTWNAVPRDLSAMRDGMKATVKGIARNKILSICPEWRQTNIVARGVEVLLKVVQGGALTNAEQAEIADGLVMWEQIKALRAKSNEIETEIDGIIDDEVKPYEEKIADLESRTSPEYVGWNV